ncbi:class I SAM-dependent methyltransferase [Sphingomonas psychrolutea]|uniref:class I SAM-dependent methyltransferase n=1 Tax=Sphingomonas psychrolutea TaxID=1259676 RepID=UPI001F21621C|nr:MULTISPECIES: class I SAM-dependent methyltransferase [Alphaproteobacteria]
MVRSSVDFYEGNAEDYAARSSGAARMWLDRFMADLPPGASVLELGCGAGHDAARLIAAGFDVTPTDGSPAMAREAERRLGRPVETLRFEDLHGAAMYDGIWASACLLHVPRKELPDVLAKIALLLNPSGLFYASYKTGGREGRDSLGRYYNRPGSSWLSRVYLEAGFQAPVIEQVNGGGFDGVATEWLHVVARPKPPRN